MDTYSELAAWDPNGAVGVKADINTGYLYLGGFLGGYTNRHTLLMDPGHGRHGAEAAGQYQGRCGRDRALHRVIAGKIRQILRRRQTLIGEWGGIIMHVKNTGGQSGWDILMYNADRNPCTVDMYCDTFGWLVK